MPVTKRVKVAIVLPPEFFYLVEPTALAFPALLGLVTFLSAQDSAAGRAQLVGLTAWLPGGWSARKFMTPGLSRIAI